MEALYQITFQNIPFHGKGQTDNAPDRTKANVPLYVIRHDPTRIFFLITILDSEHKKIQGRTTYSAFIRHNQKQNCNTIPIFASKRKKEMNQLGEKYSEEKNLELVKTSLKGSKEALNELIGIHRPYIFNVAWKFAFNPQDAEDLTQEALIKVITKLSQFKFESQFRTWLYRIVFNEFLQSKRKKGENQFTDFKDQGKRLDSIENAFLDEQEEAEYEELAKELRYRCLSGMIMCLTREQRLLFIVGETFGIDHNLGAEIFDLSQSNYRVKLHRARKELINFMRQKCGLMNPENPCRCAKKAKTMHKNGYLTEDQQFFNVGYKSKIADYVEENNEIVADLVDKKHLQLLRDIPAKDNFDKETIVNDIIGDNKLLNYFELN